MRQLLLGMAQGQEPKCVECERIFDLTDEQDASEYYYGHDCESD